MSTFSSLSARYPWRSGALSLPTHVPPGELAAGQAVHLIYRKNFFSQKLTCKECYYYLLGLHALCLVAHGPYFRAILLSLKSMERSLTNRNFLFSKQMIFLLKMSVNRNGKKLIASRRQAKISTVNRFCTS